MHVMKNNSNNNIKTGIILKSFWLFKKGDQVHYIDNADNNEDIIILDSDINYKNQIVDKVCIEKGVIAEVNLKNKVFM